MERKKKLFRGPKFWIDVQTDYETGAYSIVDLAEKYGVTNQLISDHKERDKKKGMPWKKTPPEVIIAEFRERKLQMFKRHKVLDKALNAIVSALDAERTYITPSNQTDAAGNKEPGFAEVVPDHMARMKAVEQVRKMGGLDEAAEQKVSGSMNISNSTSFSNLSTEQLKEIRKIIKPENKA